jgi:hypothetical protein
MSIRSLRRVFNQTVSCLKTSVEISPKLCLWLKLNRGGVAKSFPNTFLSIGVSVTVQVMGFKSCHHKYKTKLYILSLLPRSGAEVSKLLLLDNIYESCWIKSQSQAIGPFICFYSIVTLKYLFMCHNLTSRLWESYI